MKHRIIWKKMVALGLAFCMVFSLSACGQKQISSKNLMDDLNDDTQLDIEIDMTDADEHISPEEASPLVTDFALRLFQQNLQIENGKEDKAANTLLSPISVLMALSMTANGAKDETLEQMEEVFGLPIETLNEFAKDYLAALPNEKDYKFSMSNSIWLRDEENRLTVNADFLAKNKAYYGADVYEAPFDHTTVKDINHWIEANTDGLIKKMLEEIPYEAVMYLINACVFDAKWQNKYEKNDVFPGDFYCADGSVQSVDMMRADERYYIEDENATGFIKYYKDEKYAFVALLPNQYVELEDYVLSLNGESLLDMLNNPTEIIVHATMPKFETEYFTDIKDVLSEMGMTNVFEPYANLSGIGTSTRGNLHVSSVLHKSFIEVGESGTKAGAATIVEVEDECAPIEDNSKTVILERPFLYMIIECENNQPLFIGTVGEVDE